MKKLAKYLIVAMLGWQVCRLTKKNTFKVIAVAGSIGKTSTKLAIAKVLGQKYKVQYQDGNYNDIVTVPLIFFGQKEPSLLNPVAWLAVLIRNELIIKKPYPYEIVVVEVGVDGPGQIKKYTKYLHADIGVLTAIAPEHMEYFDSLDAVAKEEIMIAELSGKLFVNQDLCESKYLEAINKPIITYGLNKHLSDIQEYSAAAAKAVAKDLGMTTSEIEAGLSKVKPASGRMQKLEGINNSVILDDSYNASPVATIAALDMLYKIEAPHKIALLGNMNELGKYSKQAHIDVGEYCDPKKLEEIITLGPDSNKYLAEAAEKNGCKVTKFNDPYSAGNYLKNVVKERALILIKGSQNGVFAEEAIKFILANPDDSTKLVRQSHHWLRQKQKQFGVKQG